MSKTKTSKKNGSGISINMAPVIGSPFGNWLKNLFAFGPPSFKYIPRVFFVTLVSAIGIPFRMYERHVIARRLPKVPMTKDPVFILGHWRSGTTHIENLLSQDPQFGYITLQQALFPHSFMTSGLFRSFTELLMPETRPMDNMAINIQAPLEDELALSNMYRFSLYNGWQFPRHHLDFFRKYVEFEGITEAEREDWKKHYRRLLDTTTLSMQGRQLILKNPPNTARIPTLLEMYPGARFIHIYRNPYVVFLSTRNLYKKAVTAFCMQNYPADQMERDMLEVYERMMKLYLRDRELIPDDHLIEVRFEDLESDTMGELERIYRQLGLDGFEGARPHFEAYLESLGTYKKNTYKLDPVDIAKVRSRWGFALEAWKYELPD